jgi:hypothetical protein
LRKIITEILISRSEDNGHALLPHTEVRNEVNEAGAFGLYRPDIYGGKQRFFRVARLCAWQQVSPSLYFPQEEAFHQRRLLKGPYAAVKISAPPFTAERKLGII